jgi:hypothetical protein
LCTCVTMLKEESIDSAQQLASQSNKKYSYVVYVYVDYRKETGTRVLRTYTDRETAISFAKSLSTEYVRSEAQKLEDDDEDRGEDNGPEYVSYSGTEFDSRLEFPHERLTEFGMLEEEAKWFWGTRIAVDKAEQF